MGIGLSAKRLLGSSSGSFDSCKLLGIKKKKCKKLASKKRKVRRMLKRRRK